MKKYEKIYNQLLKNIQNKYGSKTTYSDFLLKLGKKYFGNKFSGVYPSDKIPNMKNNTYAIVNLDNSHEPGSHWVGIVKNKSGYLVYDSFGRKTHNILPSLEKKGMPIIDTEDDAEQLKSQEDCGQRSITALMIYHKYGQKAFLSI